MVSLANRSAAVGPAALFLAALDVLGEENTLAEALKKLGWNLEEARLYATSAIEPRTEESDAEPHLSRGAKRVLEIAASEVGLRDIGPEHLLFACLAPQKDESLLAVLAPLGWNVDELRFAWDDAPDAEEGDETAAHAANHPLAMLTVGAQKAVDAAYAAMRATYCGRISSAHLLLGLLANDNRAGELLEELGVAPEELKAKTRAAIRSDSILATPHKRFDPAAKRALDRAKVEAQTRGYKFIGADHLLLGLLPQRATLRERLTWGGGIRDEAARLLADVDAGQLRKLAGPARFKAAPGSNSPALLVFTLGFIGESVGMLVGFRHGFRTQGEALVAAYSIALGLGSLIALSSIASESKRGQARTVMTTLFQNFFFGVLIGFALGITVAIQTSR